MIKQQYIYYLLLSAGVLSAESGLVKVFSSLIVGYSIFFLFSRDEMYLNKCKIIFKIKSIIIAHILLLIEYKTMR